MTVGSRADASSRGLDALDPGLATEDAGTGVGVRVVSGTRWMALATVVVGLTNYVYALVMLRMLQPSAYSTFSAGLALLLIVGTIATASVPWVLAHEIALHRDTAARRDALWFATVANAAQSIVAAGAIWIVGRQFTTSWAVLVVLVSASTAIFMASTVIGWLQGHASFRSIALLQFVEVTTKACVGLALVSLGAGAAGALAGFAAGGVVVVVIGAVILRKDLRPRRRAMRSSRLWKQALGIGGIQGLVAVMASIDIVLVASLASVPSAVAGYQASMVLARLPIFFATAVATVTFPLFASGIRDGRASVIATSVRTYLLLGLPITCALMTIPDDLVSIVFPTGYGDVASILSFTAVTGLMLGLLNLVTVFFQAESRFRLSLTAQSFGIVIQISLLIVGWMSGDLVRFALASAGGAAIAVLVLVLASRRAWPGWVTWRAAVSWVAASAAATLALSRIARTTWLWVVCVAIAGLACALSALRTRSTPDVPASSERLRVLHLGFQDYRQPGSGGGAVRTHEVNRRLAASCDITVLTTSFPGCLDREEDGVRYVHVGWGRGYFLSMLSYFAVIPWVSRRYPADLVVEDFAAPFSSALSPLWTRRPTVAVVQWLNAAEKSRQYHLPFRAVEDLGLRLHRSYVAVSEDLGDEIRSRSADSRVDVVPNGIDPDSLLVTSPRGDDVLFVGRLETAQKGLDLLLDAFVAVAAATNANLLLAGAGNDERALHTRVQELGLQDRVQFLGVVVGERKHRLMAGAAVVVMPSRFETFGMVAVEALACATPVVAFDIPCLRAVVPPSCGALVQPFDTEQLADRLIELLDDRPSLDAMGRAGREFARGFNWDEIAAAQESAYRVALEAHATTARRMDEAPLARS